MRESLEVTWVWSGPQHGQEVFSPGASSSSDYPSLKRLFAFYWARQGKSVCMVQGKAYTVSPGDIILIQPQYPYKWKHDALEPSVLSSFAFEILTFPSHWPPREAWPVTCCLPANDIIRPMFEFIIGHTAIMLGAGTGREVPLAIQSAIESMLITFIWGPRDRLHSFPHCYPAPVQRVLEWMMIFMNTDPSKRITLDDLAAIACSRAKYLCRLFNKHLGYSPVEVLYLYRLTRSLIGLQAGRKVESLAQELGFCGASHFTRRFTALFGKSPSEMRKAMAEGYVPKMPKLPFM